MVYIQTLLIISLLGFSIVKRVFKVKIVIYESIEFMAQSAGFEPATVRLEGGCSIQLSYGRPLHTLPLRVAYPITL